MYPNSVFNHAVGSFQNPITPPTTEPGEEPTATIRVSCEWLPFIRGALAQLLLESTWDTDAAGLQSIQERVWTMIALFGDVNCEMCDCIEFNGPTPSKGIPNGTGGTTFVPVDPRTEGHVPPPWPTPPVGQTGNCLAAANIAVLYKGITDKQIAILEIDGALADLLIGIVQFLSLFAPVVGELAQVALSLAAGAITAGVAVMTNTFQGPHSDAMYAEVKCLLNCYAAADGSYTAGAIQNIKDFFALWVPTTYTDPAEQALVIFWLNDFLDSLGPNGLNAYGHLGGVTSSDCSSCDCGWVSVFDFTTSDYASIAEFVRGTWVAGQGYQGVVVSGDITSQVIYQLLAGSASSIDEMEIDYRVINPCDGTGNAENLIDGAQYGPQQAIDTIGDKILQHIETAAISTRAAIDVQGDGAGCLLYVRQWTIKGTGTKPSNFP